MIIVQLILLAVAVIVLIPVLVLSVEILAARLCKTRLSSPGEDRPVCGVLIPAHNEASLIAKTLSTIVSQLQPDDRILVVADNCNDDTAAIAKSAGAEVIERHDAARRGKGYALDYGVKHMAIKAPGVLLIIDADCEVEPGAVARLVRQCHKTQRPVQALYYMVSPEGAGLKSRFAEFAWCVKNLVRPLGAMKLGLPCQLMGTGMAFPWSVASTMDLASGHIVEDMKLGVDLALAGTPPEFCPEAVVKSYFPQDSNAVKSQRTRWEHGHLGMIMHDFPRLFFAGISRVRLSLVAMALDLVVPPLSLLAIVVGLVLVITTIAAIFSYALLPFLIAAVATGMFLLVVLVARQGWGKNILSLSEMLAVPFYILAKLPVYLKFWTKRQKDWVRTDRQ